jgi:glycosyltransferase involved in cell wall biosynthesis
MILVVAPYSGALPQDTPFIAGAKKIRTIIAALSTVDKCVVLLNSGHQVSETRKTKITKVSFGGDGLIDVITPSTKKYANIGRVANILNISGIITKIVAKYGVPNVAWFYNGYAFEMCAAACLQRNYGTRTVLEFEDWHFARNRGLNPKPYLDWLCWRLALRYLNAGFAVNSRLAAILEKNNIPTTLLPGIVSPLISELAIGAPPFRSDRITVGYFGGLSEEKGAAVLLRLAERTSDKVSFVITGRGELQWKFEALARTMPERMKFLGPVSEQALVTAVSEVDLIVNAHHINSGVFPFKIIESIASGRLLVSTELPMKGYELFTRAIEFYDGNEETLTKIVENASMIYKNRRPYILAAAADASHKYSEYALIENIQRTLGSLCVD